MIMQRKQCRKKGSAVIWKLSLASGSTGICFRKIGHSVSAGSSSASCAKEDLMSSGDDNESRMIPQAEEYFPGSNFL
jgi:hypothetical protein